MCNSLMVEFELINHYILVRRLKFSYAICGEVQRWIEYYPNNRNDIIEVRPILLCQLIFNCIIEHSKGLSLDKTSIACFQNSYVRSFEDMDCLTTPTLTIPKFIWPTTIWDTVASRHKAWLFDISDWIKTNMFKIIQNKTELLIFSPTNKSSVFSNCAIHLMVRLLRHHR